MPEKKSTSEAKKQVRLFSIDEIIPIIHSAVKEAIGSVEVEVFNGGDALVKKSLSTAMTAISQDVREVRNDLKKNTELTEKHGRLLEPKENRQKLWLQFDKTFHLKKRWKAAIAFILFLIAVFASPLLHKIFDWIFNTIHGI